MRTDRELLELAAKAGGIEVRWTDNDVFRGSFLRRVVPKPEAPCSEWLYWRPLDDDGDCARLEVACELQVDIGDIGVISERLDGTVCFEKYDDHEGDKNKTRRRASVRAAAAIGEQAQAELSREA